MVSPVDMLGIRAAMDENELIEILGSDPVHMAQKGYQMLADGLVRLVETSSTAFSGGREGEKMTRRKRASATTTGRDTSGFSTWCRVQENGGRVSRPSRSAWRREREEDQGRALARFPLGRKAVINRSSVNTVPTCVLRV